MSAKERRASCRFTSDVGSRQDAEAQEAQAGLPRRCSISDTDLAPPKERLESRSPGEPEEVRRVNVKGRDGKGREGKGREGKA